MQRNNLFHSRAQKFLRSFTFFNDNYFELEAENRNGAMTAFREHYLFLTPSEKRLVKKELRQEMLTTKSKTKAEMMGMSALLGGFIGFLFGIYFFFSSEFSKEQEGKNLLKSIFESSFFMSTLAMFLSHFNPENLNDNPAYLVLVNLENQDNNTRAIASQKDDTQEALLYNAPLKK